MAGAYGAAASTSASASPATSSASVPRKSVVLVSHTPLWFPSRRRRTNHLRKKILKTLEMKPYPDTSHIEFPRKTETLSIEETVQQQPFEVDQFSLSETTGFVDGNIGKFSTRSFVKIGLYLVGAFIFQTICAVLIFGINDLEGEDDDWKSDNYKKARALDLDVTGNSESKSKSKSNSPISLVETKEGGMVSVHESEMDSRIMEIQAMAREARQQEKLGAKGNRSEEEGDDDADYDLTDKNVKEKEVDGRLMKLRKSLEGNYEKLPNKFPRKEGDVRNNVDKGISAAGEAFGPLMFKKKYKYKRPSIDSGDKPKGFDGAGDRYVANGTMINGIAADVGALKMDKENDDSEQIGLPNGNGSEITSTRFGNKEQEQIDKSMPVIDSGNTLVNSSYRAKPRVTKAESLYGTSKEPKYDKQESKAATTGKSSNMETRKPRGFSKENQSNATLSTEQADSNRKSSSKGKKRGNRKSVRDHGDMSSSTPMGFWWTSLPYVLAVLMQRGGSNNEESEGLFTLRSISQSKSGLSHTVAFEDRADATNFCYLLESFFQDLGDFSTNIIPIPTNELEEAVKSQIMKVVVVKKGQLQLYVGQPLTDVESTLRTLIDQDDKP